MAGENDARTPRDDPRYAAEPAARAKGEIAPRAEESAFDTAGASADRLNTRAVDENRPVDVVSGEGMYGITAPRMQPNVLQRGYVIGDATHAAETTANLGPVGETELDEEEWMRTAAAGSVDLHSFSEGQD